MMNTTGGNYESSGSQTREAIGSTMLNNQGAGTFLTIKIGANDPTAKYAGSNPNPGATNYGDSATWMPLEILVAQRLYGAATTGPLSGGRTFGYNDNVDGLVAGVGIHNSFDFPAITTPVLT